MFNKGNTMKKLTIGIMCLVLITIFGCSGMGINLDTMEKKYLGARTELNLLIEEYIQMQDQVSESDHETAKNAFYAADKALDTWELMLGNENYDFSTDIRIWLEAKRVIIEILRRTL